MLFGYTKLNNYILTVMFNITHVERKSSDSHHLVCGGVYIDFNEHEDNDVNANNLFTVDMKANDITDTYVVHSGAMPYKGCCSIVNGIK